MTPGAHPAFLPARSPAFKPVLLLATLLLLAAHPGSASAADPLTAGRKALAAGKWDKAEAKLRKALRGPTRDEARLVLADLLLLRGRADEAATLAADSLLRPQTASAGAALIGRANLLLGRTRVAKAVLTKALKADPQAQMVQVLLARSLLDLGDARGARSLLEPLLRKDDQGAYRTPEGLTVLGQAARMLGRTRFAFQALDEATQAAPASADPFVELGRTALDVGDTVNAEAAFQQALKLRPEDPHALVGLARIELEIGRTFDDAMALLDRAEAVYPEMPAAQRLRAEADILGEQPEAALARLDKLVKANPHDLQARTLIAAAHDARGDYKAFERSVRAIHKIRKDYADVFTTVARFAERQTRYPRAIELAKRALETNPDHWTAHAVLGVQYTRTGVPGDEDRGRRHLERYYERDDYDVRVTNLLNLYERWLGDYVWIEDPEIRVRAHRSEASIAERVILPFARQMLARYDERYGYKPPRPIVLELFHKPDLFSLRSVGLPGTAPHGICFGRLVTFRSPSEANFSWGMVVAHELAHVYGLGGSDHRLPRWWGEGLAEYETNVLRPEWTRQHGQELFNALQAGRLPGVLDLSRAFTQAHTLGDVVVAYQQSSLVMHHLVDTVGYDKVIGAHARFRKGASVAEVITALTGLKPADFDRRFAEWLRHKTARYAGNWDLDKALYREAQPLRDAVSKAPSDAGARARLAAHLLIHGEPGPALLQARRALGLKPRHALAQFVVGSALKQRKELDEAKPHFEQMIEDGHDGYVVRRALVDIGLEQGDADATELHMRAAQALDPEQSLPHSGLARLLDKMDRPDEAEEHHERWAMLSAGSPTPPRRLAQAASDRGDTVAALRWSEHLRFIAPYDPVTHLLRAQVFERLGKQALLDVELANANAAADPASAKAQVALALALEERGFREQAAQAAKRAAALAPDDAEVQKLVGRLTGAP